MSIPEHLDLLCSQRTGESLILLCLFITSVIHELAVAVAELMAATVPGQGLQQDALLD